MSGLPLIEHPDLLVGLEQADDAGVFRLTDEIALVQTIDFFTPIVDDPFRFGQIAAANALSDIYAMGAVPLCAMNMICFPIKKMDISVLKETLAGGLDKIREAGAVLVGGHSIDDKEFKYGLSVTGKVHPKAVRTNHGARPGDHLVLTKPLGTGIVSTAGKADLASAEAIAAIVDSMAALNASAAKVMQNFEVHACTDVTGFGLGGHAAEMLEGSELGLKIHTQRLPLFPDVEQYCNQGLLPGGLHRNRKYRQALTLPSPKVAQYLQDLLFDPQTSGGLLIAIAPDSVTPLLDQLHGAGLTAATDIAEFVSQPAGKIELI